MYFNVHFNVSVKLIKMHFVVSELYIYQNARCNNKKNDCSGQSIVRSFFMAYNEENWK